MGYELDVSNYDRDTFNVECFKASDVSGLIVGCQRPDVASWMIHQALTGNLPVRAVYAFLYFGIDSIGQTRNAVQVAREFKIPYVTLDVESTPPHEAAGITPWQRINELRQCVNYVEDSGLSVIIYTGGWYWPSAMANTNEFSEYPLHHAAYRDYFGTPYEVRRVNYGGWTDVAIHQWTSTLNICGRGRDSNHIWNKALFEEVDMFTDNDREMLYGLIDLLIGRADGVEYTNDIDRLIALRAAVTNDLRFAQGLGETQGKVAALTQAVSELAQSGSNPGLVAKFNELVTSFQKLSDGFEGLASIPVPDRAGAVENPPGG